MVTVIPYLSFRGNCEEALNTYIEAFGGEIYYISRWSEKTFEVTPEQIGKVMHVEFALGNTRMAAGDVFEGENTNTSIKLMIHMDSQEEALHTISVLANGGTIISPLQPHPEPDDAGCGSITKDRFGYTWIITCPNPDKQLKKTNKNLYKTRRNAYGKDNSNLWENMLRKNLLRKSNKRKRESSYFIMR